MKLGISASWKHSSPADWAKKMTALGCTAVVFPTDYRSDAALIDEYIKEAKAHNLVIAEVGAWCNPLASDKEEREKSMERCIGQLQLADYVGAKCCVNVTGAAGEKWDGAYKENFDGAFYEKTVECIKTIIERANPKNTFYTIEPMPWMVPTSPDEYLKLINDVGSNRFAVHMDMTNWMCTPKRYLMQRDFMDDVFEKLGQYIKSCHLKDAVLLPGLTFQVKEVMCGQGGFDMDYYVSLINALDYDMPVMIEHLHSEKEFEESMKYVRERFSDKI